MPFLNGQPISLDVSVADIASTYGIIDKPDDNGVSFSLSLPFSLSDLYPFYIVIYLQQNDTRLAIHLY